MSNLTNQATLRLAVSQRPEDMAARAALAQALVESGERNEGLAILRDGLFFAGGREDRLELLADAFMALDSWHDAIDALQSAMRVAPNEGRFPARLSGLWAQLGDMRRAAESASHAAALGIQVVTPDVALDATLTRQLFNQYAAGFDEHLTGVLKYDVPRQMVDMLAPYLGTFPASTIVDLGCGTGLMGVRLREAALQLVGVDLSPGMLEEARGKNVYDRLYEQDVVTFLEGFAAPIAVITAADVLIYLGELGPLFAAAAARLSPGGLMALSVETGEGKGYVRKESNRYAHGEAYLRWLANSNNFEILACDPIVVRFDAGQPIDGLLMLLRKPIAPSSCS